MTLMRYQRNNNWNRNMNALNQFRHELFNAFDSTENRALLKSDNTVAAQNWTPAVDIKEHDNNFVIYADIPGVDPKDIEIQLEDAVLTIKGERLTESNEQQDSYKRVERSNGSFYRRFSLPDSADAENITAKSVNGVLQLTIAKTEKVKPRRIEIDH